VGISARIKRSDLSNPGFTYSFHPTPFLVAENDLSWYSCLFDGSDKKEDDPFAYLIGNGTDNMNSYGC